MKGSVLRLALALSLTLGTAVWAAAQCPDEPADCVTPTPTATRRPTRTPRRLGGDCDAGGDTVISELQQCVNLFLGDDVGLCPACDLDGDGEVGIVDLQGSVNCFLDPESSACLEAGLGAICGDGDDEAPEECDDGDPYGGDGCAPNCTVEYDFVIDYGTTETSQSAATLQATLFALSLRISGLQVVTRGRERPDEVFGVGGVPLYRPNEVPISTVVDANAGLLNPISVPGLVCACIRFAELRTCGGRPRLPGDSSPLDCSGDPSLCDGGEECLPVFGPGVAGAGVGSCDGLDDVDYLYSTDAGTGAVTYEAAGFASPAVLNVAYTAIGIIQGNCNEDPGDPNKGVDGLPCTDDDPPAVRGAPIVTVQTTGSAAGRVLDANGLQDIDDTSVCGEAACVTSVTGTAPSCENLIGNLGGLCLASTLTILDQPQAGDVVVTSRFCALN